MALTRKVKDLRVLFDRGWHLDGLRNGLIHKIEWVETMVSIYERMDDPMEEEKK